MCGPEPKELSAYLEELPLRSIRFQLSNGTLVSIEVRVASSPEQMFWGFQYAKPDELENNVILFALEAEMTAAFHMKNVDYALDLMLVGADGQILDIQRMHPGSKHYGIKTPVRYALEARAGFFTERGITAGVATLVLDSVR